MGSGVISVTVHITSRSIALIPVLLAVVCFRKAMPIVILTMWATDTIVGRFTPSVRDCWACGEILYLRRDSGAADFHALEVDIGNHRSLYGGNRIDLL
jgi:hypothetical protein|tara:strand:+ start:833 stop:1126 length:294 start_codon:yes stop_codon:yes gene_type:complete